MSAPVNGARGAVIRIAASTLLAASFLIIPVGSRAEPSEQPESFTLVSYNVRGLPNGSRNAPRRRFPAIGRLTNEYDLILNQEVFAGAARLVNEMKDKQAVSGVGLRGDAGRILLKGLFWPASVFVEDFWPPYGCGLYTFVDPRLIPGGDHLTGEEIETEPYRACHGYLSSKHDCFARKGYLRVGITAPGGVAVDVYNTHLDAGDDDGSRDARMAQLLQLACAIDARNSARPVIIAGDLNIGYVRAGDREALAIFREHLGLADSGASAQDPHWCERDHILYRDGADARLIVERFGENEKFVRDGFALSDHPALFAEFRAERDGSGRRDTPAPRRRIDCHPTTGANAP